MDDPRIAEGPVQPLRILCLTTSFPSSPEDPAGFFIFQLADALSRRGARVQLLTPAIDQAPFSWPPNLNVRRFSYAPRKWQILAQRPGGIPVALNQSRRNFFLLPSFFASFVLNLLVLARKADVVLANWATLGALAAWLTPVHKKPVVTVLRGSDVTLDDEEGSTSFLLNAAFRGSRAVVCVGEELEEWIRKTSPSPEKLHHIPNGIHEHFFQLSFPESGPEVRALFIGSLIPRKGVDILLQAIARLKDENVNLTIVGQGPLEQALKGLAEELRIDRQVVFEGRVSPGKPMAELMSRAHFLVLPSHHEGRPNVVIEAMAAGRAVIGSDIHGIRECINQSQGGLLFPDGDPNGLAGAIRNFIEQPESMFVLGQKARRWVISRGLTWENTADRYLRLMAPFVEAARK